MCEERTTEPVVEPSGARTAGRPRPYKPAEARRAVERAVAERCRTAHRPCDADALSDAVLVASELTTNALLHGGGITDFRVDVTGRDVRVSVSDRSAEPPVVVPPADGQARRRPGGHGWPIVCRLACDVHVSCLPTGGKCITAVVPLF
ncbi:ATP-binding protein [Streptomyces sp. NPDC051207]|uniref:ATP-binding protein n=1 Tax=Streptomyces sp. NPDC051207 TaxID=3154641 RepID=UPI003434D324